MEITKTTEAEAHTARRALIDQGVTVSLVAGDTRYEPMRYTFEADTTPAKLYYLVPCPCGFRRWGSHTAACVEASRHSDGSICGDLTCTSWHPARDARVISGGRRVA